MKKTLLFVVISAMIQQASFGQWSKGQGKGYYKLSAWYLKTDKHYTDTGNTDPNITRTQFNINAYVEYGIANQFDLIAYVPFYARATQNNVFSGTTGNLIQNGEAISSIGDIDLGINYGFYKKRNWAASVKILFGLPTGEKSGGSDGSYQTGDGEFNQFLSVALGYATAFNHLPFYAKTYLGYNNRSQNFSDEFRFGLESGINIFNKKLWIIGRLNVVESLRNGSLNAQNNTQGSIFANNVEFINLGAEVSYYITKKIGVSLNYDGAVSGRIIAANPSISGGVFLDIR
ncbi:MAG: hypothetical protein GKR88_12680 [Flavobacteriaceae bacterium]|nr:MAG: hypothetical protein GKR88_12680 [Flavobacteriaceae bacterium]